MTQNGKSSESFANFTLDIIPVNVALFDPSIRIQYNYGRLWTTPDGVYSVYKMYRILIRYF